MHALLVLLTGISLSTLVAGSTELGRYDCDINPLRCQYLPDYAADAALSERDVSMNVSIANIPLVGTSLSDSVFSEGYIQSSLNQFANILDFGYQAIGIDVYNYMGSWQLCPGVLPSSTSKTSGTVYQNLVGNDNITYTCQSNVTISSLYSQIMSFIARSDLALTANMILITLNLHSLDPTGAEFTNDASELLSIDILQTLAPRLLTPSVRAADQLPTLSDFLFEIRTRILITANNVSLSPHLNYSLTNEAAVIYLNFTAPADNAAYFSASTVSELDECPSNASSQPAQFFQTDFNSWSNETLRRAMFCGFSPIITDSLLADSALGPPIINSYWSWAANEPVVNDTSSSKNDDDGPSANQCALLSQRGWVVGNCYTEYPLLCRSETDWSDFRISETSHTYFLANGCPNGYKLAVPNSPYEQRIAMSVLKNSASPLIWMDWNCLATSGCWVTGGVSASCPYHRYSVNRNGVALLSTSATVSFCIFVVGVLLMVDKVPFRHNQAKWRRLYNRYAQHEYEGIPA